MEFGLEALTVSDGKEWGATMNTYANVILKGPQREAIVANLTAHKQRAFIGPTVNGLTFVYTPFDTWTEGAEGLSSGLQCSALFAYGYDSDVFGYTLYDSGQVQDTYVSAVEDDFTGDGPELSEGPAGGNTDALCRFVGADQAVAQVDVILHADRGVAIPCRNRCFPPALGAR